MIVAAAVTVNGQVHSIPPPARHHTILHSLGHRGLLPPGRRLDQGFIDRKERFVTRAQALEVVISQNQPLAPKPDGTPRTRPDHALDLFSEDLW